MKQTDLQKFKKIYGHDKVKELPGKLEYRVQNLDVSLKDARKVITDNKLNLVAKTSGSMAQIRAFEVVEVEVAA